MRCTIEMHDVHGIDFTEALENLIQNQIQALAHRKAGLSSIEVAGGASASRPAV